MLRRVALLVMLLLAVFGVVVAMQPAAFRVARSTSIQAPPQQVFALVNDFHHWDQWSPWAKLDPNMRTTYSGTPSGPGSVYQWTGNDKVGQGRMTITHATPASQVDVKLEFIKPIESESITTFVFQPEGSGTRVDWIMTGENNFLGKLMCLVRGGMDKMVGPDFERGLAQMKAAAESRR